MVLQYWRYVVKRGAKEAARFMALHKFWVALSPATLAPIYLWILFRVHGVTNFWKIALSAAMGYATAFVFAFIWKLFSVPARLHHENLDAAAQESAKHKLETENLKAESEARLRQQAESHASQREILTAEITKLNDSIKREEERQSKKFSFWLEAKRSEPSRGHHFRYIENGEEKTMQAVIPFIRLLVCNEGTVPLRVSGYMLWNDINKGNTVTSREHLHVVQPGQSPIIFEATTSILEAISGRAPFDWSKVQGNHAISFAIQYQDGGETKQSEPQKRCVRIFSTGGKTLEGEVSSFPFCA